MSKKKEGFEEKLYKINEIISKLESRSVALEDSLKLYEEAMNLVKDCHLVLEDVEAKVTKVVDKKNKELEEFNV